MLLSATLRLLAKLQVEIPPETRDEYPDIPWKKIVGLRNILIHEYFGIDIEIIWDVVENHLGNLKIEVQRIVEYQKLRQLLQIQHQTPVNNGPFLKFHFKE